MNTGFSRRDDGWQPGKPKCPYYYFTLLNLNIGTSWGSLSKCLDATKANLLSQEAWNASRRASYAQMPFGKLQKEAPRKNSLASLNIDCSWGKFTGATAAIEANHGSGGLCLFG